MGKTMIKIFDIYQYIYYNSQKSEDYLELQQYIEKNKITIQEDEIIISGRIIDGIIGVGDKLFPEDMSSILCVKNVYSYGHEFDYLSAGMTCAITVVTLKQACNLKNTKFLTKKRKQNILAKGFEYWATSTDGLVYKEVDNPEITARLKEMVSFVENNGDLFTQKILEDNELYSALSLWKDKHNLSQTVYQILNELQLDSLSYWLEEESITLMLSAPNKDNCMFGHYIQVDFDMKWNMISWSIC